VTLRAAAVLVAAALALLALPPPADAHHCAAWSTSETYIDSGVSAVGRVPTGATGAAGVYVHLGYYHFLLDWWIYQESNGIPGLQRGDSIRDDTCHRMIPPDTVIF